MHDQFDVTLEDGDLLGEVELTTTLIIAASESDDHLSARGDRPPPRGQPRASRRTDCAATPLSRSANSTGPLVRSDST